MGGTRAETPERPRRVKSAELMRSEISSPGSPGRRAETRSAPACRSVPGLGSGPSGHGKPARGPRCKDQVVQEICPLRLCRPIGRAPSARMSGADQGTPPFGDPPGLRTSRRSSWTPLPRCDIARGWRRRVSHRPPPTRIRRHYPPLCATALPIPSLTALEMRQDQLEAGWRNRHGGVPSRYTQGRRLEKALADSDVDRPRCSSSMRVMRRNSSRSWPVMTACSWASAMATG